MGKGKKRDRKEETKEGTPAPLSSSVKTHEWVEPLALRQVRVTMHSSAPRPLEMADQPQEDESQDNVGTGAEISTENDAPAHFHDVAMLKSKITQGKVRGLVVGTSVWAGICSFPASSLVRARERARGHGMVYVCVFMSVFVFIRPALRTEFCVRPVCRLPSAVFSPLYLSFARLVTSYPPVC